MLKIEHLSKSFGKKQVLTDISYEFQNGVYGLLGPNGAGKTTFLKCILNLCHYKQGTISFDAQTADKDKPPMVIGYLPQKTGVFSGLTVEEQLMYFANLKDMDKSLWEDEIKRVLELVNLSDVRTVKGKKLSGGMVRRVGVAQALLNHPSLLIMDEPTTGLDPEERLRFKNMIHQLKKDAVVILSTHIVEDVEAVCDRILILKDGRLVTEGLQEEISGRAEGKVYEVSKNQYVEGEDYIEREKEQDGETVFRILTNRTIEGISPRQPDIEDGYLCVLKDI